MEAGLPVGAQNVVTSAGRVIGDNSSGPPPRLDVITFTGSPYVGESIRAKAGLKRVTLELGSNSAVIVDSVALLHSRWSH